jgi:ribosomal subunit interface protein
MMEIIIHARNGALAEDFREIVQEKLSSMDRFSIPIDRVEVEVFHEVNPRQGKHSHRVTVTSHGTGPLIRATGAEFNDLAAFDAAIKVFDLQIRKLHEKSKDFDRETLRTKPIVISE